MQIHVDIRFSWGISQFFEKLSNSSIAELTGISANLSSPRPAQPAPSAALVSAFASGLTKSSGQTVPGWIQLPHLSRIVCSRSSSFRVQSSAPGNTGSRGPAGLSNPQPFRTKSPASRIPLIENLSWNLLFHSPNPLFQRMKSGWTFP